MKLRPEYEEIYAHPDSHGIIDRIWLIGNDLGDLHYFYGNGEEGFGLYVAQPFGSINYNQLKPSIRIYEGAYYGI